MASSDNQRGNIGNETGIRNNTEDNLSGDAVLTEAAPVFQVAQADTGAAEATEVAATGNPATLTVEIGEDLVARLPEGTSLDAPRQNGADLEFVQPDGSVIVITGGAVTGLTIFIGDVEIPPDGVQVIFDTNGIQPAEGPGEGPAGDSHGNYADVPIGNVGDGLAIGDLLPPTELAFGQPEFLEEFPVVPPTMLIGAGFVEEDDLAMRVGERSDGNNEDGSVDAHTFSGTLVSDFGSGGSAEGDALYFTGTPPAGLFSQGEPITYTIVGNGAGQTLQAFASSGPGDEPRLVFELELIVSGNTGSYTFTLYDQLDHALTDNPDTSTVETAFEDILALGFGIGAQNALGGSNSGTLDIGVQDDIPVYIGEGSTYYIDEDDIDTDNDHDDFKSSFDGPGYHFEVQDGSLGTSPNDGPGWPDFDGSFTDSPLTNGPGPAFIQGSVADLFKVGSDEFPGDRRDDPTDSEIKPAFTALFAPTPSGSAQFALSDENIAEIEAMGLTSKSEGLAYYLAQNPDGSYSLFGYVPGETEIKYEFTRDAEVSLQDVVIGGDEVSGRLVFKFDLDSDGDFEFRLFDQLDHSDPGVGTPGEPVEDLISLDFSSLVTISDYDGDTITAPEGALVIKVRDDVPELADARPVNIVVDEDDIQNEQSLGTSPQDGDGDGSFTQNEGDDVPGPATAEADISGLVVGGADEEITFSFLNAGALRTYLETLGLMSQGRPIGYDLTDDGVIIGFVNAEGGDIPGVTYDPGEGDRQVFKLSLSEDGHVKVELYDQLDHVAPDSGADENQTLEESGFSQLNLGDIILATDHDGDSITLGGQVTISVTDDVPVLTGESITRTVDEDDIENEQSLGTSPQDGDGDGSFTENPGDETPGAAHVFGSLTSLVQSGADEGLTFGFGDESAIRDALEGLGLTSQGGELSYDVEGDTLYAFVNADAPGVIYNEGQDRLVFSLTVSPEGEYEFKLHDQLDHDAPGDDAGESDALSDENFDLQDGIWGDVTSIDFGQFINATDYDGDSVALENGLVIEIRDDVPVKAEDAEAVTITVDEDDIVTDFSTGSAPEDTDDPDGSFTGPADSSSGGPANASGSLAGLADPGADEPLTYGFTANAVADMLEMSLTSQGRTISYQVVGDTLVAFINDGDVQPGQSYDPPADTYVFTMQVDPETGDFTFSLYDQLDHDPGLGQNSLDIDFGSVLQATDYDGDSVVLDALVNVSVTDDVPVLADIAPVELMLDEDDIDTETSHGSQADDGAGDGSYTGYAGVENGDNPAYYEGAANASANLAALVASGADEPVTFAFIADNQVRSALETLHLMSGGRQIGYDLQTDGTIIGFVNAEGGAVPGQTYDADEGDRLVFEITLTESGDLTVMLYDQLDHVAPGNGADENQTLQTSGLDALNLGSLITATDFDGDSINLDGQVLIHITDDIPSVEALAGQGPLTIDETSGLQDNDVASNPTLTALFAGVVNKGNDPDMTTQYAQQAGFVVADVTPGADEPASVSWALELNGESQFVYSGLQTIDGNHNIFLSLENGIVVGRVDENGTNRGHTSEPAAFAIHLNADGTLTVVQYMALRHIDANDFDATDSIIANMIRAVATVTDADGDHASDSIDIGAMIQFDDDGPSVGSNETVVVEDDDLAPNGIEGGVGDDYAPINTTGTLSHAYGSDGAGSTLLTGADLPLDGDFGVEVTNGGLTLYITQHGENVLQVQLSSTAGGNYTVTQLKPIDHPAGLDENNVEFTIQYQVTDGDGDYADGTMTVSVDDDTPVLLQASPVELTLDEDDIDTSLSLGNHPNDTDVPDGSYTGEAGVDAGGPATASGTLTQFVAPGADVPLTFGIYSGDLSALADLGITSHGDSLSFEVDTSVPGVEVLRALANDGSGDRTVFELTVNADGTFDVALFDQVDHVAPPAGTSVENFDITATPSAVTVLPIGDLIEARDNDGDAVLLGDRVTLQVHDDVPEIVSGAVPVSGSVQEAEIVEPPENVAMSLHIVQPNSSGNTYDNHYFDTDTLEVLVNGSPVAYNIVLGTGTSLDTYDSHNVVKFGDVSGARSFEITFDAPEGSDIQINYDHKVGEETPDANEGIRIDLYVDGAFEQTIADHTNDSDYVGGSYPWAADSASYDGAGVAWGSPDTTSVELADLVAVGADEEITFSLTSFDATNFGAYESEGEQIMISSDGDTLTGTAHGETIFTLTVSPSGSATFSLYGEFDHDGADSLALELGNFVQATDFDGDTIGLDADLLVINVEDGNDPLDIIGEVSGTVEEEQLDPQMQPQPAYPVTAEGIDDEDDAATVGSVGDNDTPEDHDQTTNVASGELISELAITGDDGALSFAFSGVPEGGIVPQDNPSEAITSGGENVLFHMISETEIVGYVEAGGTGDYDEGTDHVVFSVEITDQTTGAWTFTLFDKIDHHSVESADDVEKSVAINLSNLIEVTDTGGAGDTAMVHSFVVNVIDDIPVANASSAEVDEGGTPTVNAVLVLDLSGSMQWNLTSNSGTGYEDSRLNLMQDAIENLLSSSGVNFAQVTVYTYAGNGTFRGTFNSAGDAISEVQSYDFSDLDNATNFDAAAEFIMANYTAFDDTSLPTNLYWLTDADSQSFTQMDGTTAANWAAFLDAQGIDEALAVGFSGSASVGDLDDIAPRADDTKIIIDDPTDLSDTLVGTLPDTVSGNIIEDAVGTAFGADGGHILSITVGGVVHNAADGNLTDVATSIGGTFSFDFTTGEWSYEPPAAGVDTDTDEVFTYTLIDGDGDTSSADLTITVNNVNSAPVAADDTVLTNIVDGSMIHIPTNALTWNDSDPDGDPLSITDVSNPVGGTAAPGSIDFDPTNPAPVNTTTVYEFDDTTKWTNDNFAFKYSTGASSFSSFKSITPGTIISGGSEATNGQYNQIENADSTSWGTGDPGNSRHQVAMFQFTIAEIVAAITQIDVSVAAGRPDGARGSDHLLLAVWNGTGWEQIGATNATNGTIDTINHSLTTNLANYVDGGGKVTLALYNEDADDSSGTDGAILIDNVELHVISTTPGIIADGSVDYTVSDGSLEDTAGVDIHGVAGNTITATSDDGQILIGGDGADFLVGGEGDDVLIGGLGSDHMEGNRGADLFVISADTVAPGILDVIADYDSGEGDVVDLTDLFSVGNSEAVADYVQYDDTTGMIQVDQDGASGPASFENVVDIGPGLAGTINIIFDDDGNDTSGTI